MYIQHSTILLHFSYSPRAFFTGSYSSISDKNVNNSTGPVTKTYCYQGSHACHMQFSIVIFIWSVLLRCKIRIHILLMSIAHGNKEGSIECW
jgi:hypothetical protein